VDSVLFSFGDRAYLWLDEPFTNSEVDLLGRFFSEDL
jgi:hypothetical protein